MKEVNRVDEDGYALIHYLSFFNMGESIQSLKEFGADLSIKAK